MTIRCRRRILTLGILVGFLWNLLSLLGVIPLNRWRVTFVFVGIAALINLLPAVVQLPGMEAPKHVSQLTAKERHWMFLILDFGVAWGVTVIACIVLPL